MCTRRGTARAASVRACAPYRTPCADRATTRGSAARANTTGRCRAGRRREDAPSKGLRRRQGGRPARSGRSRPAGTDQAFRGAGSEYGSRSHDFAQRAALSTLCHCNSLPHVADRRTRTENRMGRCMVGVSVVKNEADIIEANVRHNLRYLDRIVVFDHDSCDATPRILDALAKEGLPVTLLTRRADKREFGFWQGEFMTALAKLAFDQHGADQVFPID